MSKTITLRLSDEEYRRILTSAKKEHRPISNFISHIVFNTIEESMYAEPIEMSQIQSDEKLLESLKAGHQEAEQKKGRFVE